MMVFCFCLAAAKMAVNMFIADKITTPREKDLFKSLKVKYDTFVTWTVFHSSCLGYRLNH